MPKEKEYKFHYVDSQTPIERLRNFLSRTYTLISILKDERAKEIDTEDLIIKANQDLETVRDLLFDIDLDYETFEDELKKCREQ